MKLLLNLCGIGAFGLLGYSLEPNLRFQLTGEKPGKVEVADQGKVILQMEDGTQVELESLTPEQLPGKVLVKSALTASDSSTGITMNIPAGIQVKLVRIEGANAVVSPGEGSYIGKIPVAETDLLKQLTEHPPVMGGKPAKTTAEPVAVAPTVGESAEPPALPEPPPVPEPAPVTEPPPTPEPVAAADPVVMPAPAAPDQPAVGAGTSDVVKTMQDSVKAAQVKEFKFDQVTEWKAGEPETVDGESFETGTALYKAVTFLGEKTIEAKAFIKGGKVQRWIWPRSGMEIK